MGEIDHRILNQYSEEDLFLSEVVQNDHELLYLDSYLSDLFR